MLLYNVIIDAASTGVRKIRNLLSEALYRVFREDVANFDVKGKVDNNHLTDVRLDDQETDDPWSYPNSDPYGRHIPVHQSDANLKIDRVQTHGTKEDKTTDNQYTEISFSFNVKTTLKDDSDDSLIEQGLSNDILKPQLTSKTASSVSGLNFGLRVMSHLEYVTEGFAPTVDIDTLSTNNNLFEKKVTDNSKTTVGIQSILLDFVIYPLSYSESSVSDVTINSLTFSPFTEKDVRESFSTSLNLSKFSVVFDSFPSYSTDTSSLDSKINYLSVAPSLRSFSLKREKSTIGLGDIGLGVVVTYYPEYVLETTATDVTLDALSVSRTPFNENQEEQAHSTFSLLSMAVDPIDNTDPPLEYVSLWEDDVFWQGGVFWQ